MDCVSDFLEDFSSEFQKVVMVNLGDYDISNLPLRKETNIGGIRLAFHKKDLDEEQQAWIKDQMKETKALEDSIALAKELGNEAIAAVSDENSPELVMIMKAMIEREF